MTEDLRPLPRLPLDTAETATSLSNGLNVYTVEEPGEGVAQTSMIETRTPTYNAPVAYCEVYHKPVWLVYPDVSSAVGAAAPVTERFSQDPSRPPQWRGILDD